MDHDIATRLLYDIRLEFQLRSYSSTYLPARYSRRANPLAFSFESRGQLTWTAGAIAVRPIQHYAASHDQPELPAMVVCVMDMINVAGVAALVVRGQEVGVDICNRGYSISGDSH